MTGENAPPILELRGVTVEYPSRGNPAPVQAVCDVSLEVRPGEAVGIVGESGCGKSTLLRCIVGLAQPSSGEVLFDGRDMRSAIGPARRDLRRRIQLVFQDPFASLNPRHRIGDIVAEGLLVHRPEAALQRRDRVVRMLERVGLDGQVAERYPHELSGGQRQRVALARALVLEPELLLLDEPVSALDVSVQSQVLSLIAELRSALAFSYLFIGHHIGVVRRMCDRVAVMYLGRVIESGPAQEVLGRPRHPYTQALVASSLEPGPAARLRKPIGGEPPSPVRRPPGCEFHPRCEHATSECRVQAPALQQHQASQEAKVACFHADRIAALPAQSPPFDAKFREFRDCNSL